MVLDITLIIMEKLIEMATPSKSKRLTISKQLDPLNVKQDIINQKIGMRLDTSHSIKKNY